MVINNINIIELIADSNKYITNLDKTQAFKRVVCKVEEISNYVEISESEYEEIMRSLSEKSDGHTDDVV